MNDKLLLHDSETLKHINDVRENIWKLIRHLDERAQKHDASKMENPEREIFADNTPELAKVEYGSEEYRKLLEKVKPAIDNHYAKNRHHPEHFSNGIEGMDLLDILEMVSDWASATKRNKNGNIHKSIEINTERFKMTPQLAKILTNTVDRYF